MIYTPSTRNHVFVENSGQNLLFLTRRSYIGPGSASEPETRAVIKYVHGVLANQTAMTLSYHSFGQVFFLPYAYGGSHGPRRHNRHPNWDKMFEYANKAAFQIFPHYYRKGKLLPYNGRFPLYLFLFFYYCSLAIHGLDNNEKNLEDYPI